MSDYIQNNLLDATSSITETSDVFITNIVQSGGKQLGGFFPLDLFFDVDEILIPFAVVCCLTVCCMSCTLICIIHNQSMCR
jgi:hypothetical protein